MRSFIFFAKGHGYPMGFPRWMQEAKTMVSAPLFTSSRARSTDFLAGQPPQLIKPMMSMSSSIPSKAPFFSRMNSKSVVPGQIPGANSVPLEELEKHLPEFPPNQEIVAYCRGRNCVLSVEAVELLRSHGFQAFRLEENAQEWQKKIRR